MSLVDKYKKCLKHTAHISVIEIEKGFITNLRPEGSFNESQLYKPTERDLKRPSIFSFHTILYLLVILIIFVCICLVNVYVACFLLSIYILIRLRMMIVWIISVYQRYASDNIRLSCVFEPSCSEYMIMSINKYGVLRGVIKGFNRLKRCRYPNFGEDYP